MKRLKAGSGAMLSPYPSKSEDDYRGEDDHRTLTRAEEIRGDATRMKGVVKHQRKSESALANVGASLEKDIVKRKGRKRVRRSRSR